LFSSMVNAMSLKVGPSSLVTNMFTSGWFWMGCLILFPLITMRLFAEESKMGTMEGLLTAPVRTSEIVFAKYFAAVLVYITMVLPVFLFFPVFERITGDQAAFHSGAFFGSGLGILLIGLFSVAIGTLASALTSNQLIAAMVTFVSVMLHYLLGFVNAFATVPNSTWRSALEYFSSTEHMRWFCEGLIDSRPIIYYLSFSALLLAITHYIIESRKWRA
ncbi:MAG: ABC transporter permease, partial [Verrucomicrobiota bacterium]